MNPTWFLGDSVEPSTQRLWTQISSVDGLSAQRGKSFTRSCYFEYIARTVSKLKIIRIPSEDLHNEEPLGNGETFAVTRAQHHGKTVAVKYLKLSDQGDEAVIQRRLHSVLLEICIMNHGPLADHDNILCLLGYGWQVKAEGPMPYTVVECGDRGTLRQWLQTCGEKYSTSSKVTIINDIASALNAIHQCHVVHGDLKLDNIIAIAGDDVLRPVTVKVADFGHSIVADSTSQKSIKYHGTSLYNSPEVLGQDRTPITQENLYKCDVWAFGLLSWEILADGERYFDPEWRSRYIRKCDAQCQNPKSDTKEDHTSQCQNHSISAEHRKTFGAFDVNYLGFLSICFVNKKFATHNPGTRTHLRSFFHRTLHRNPSVRSLATIHDPRNLNDTNEDYVEATMKPVQIDLSDTGLEIFGLSGGQQLIWACQQRILLGFENAAAASPISQEAMTASLQAGLCYLLGFGTIRDLRKAVRHFENAAGLAHPLAALLHLQMEKGAGGVTVQGYNTYKSFLVRKIRERTMVGLKRGSKAIADQLAPSSEYSSIPATSTSIKTVSSESLLTIKQVSSNSSQDLLAAPLAFHSANSMSECAGETPLILACRLGDVKNMASLLRKGADPLARSAGGCTVYHWLFCIEDSVSTVESLLFRADLPLQNVLDLECIREYSLHKEWPLPLRGTPLAFAVTAASRITVELLLRYGANPVAPAFPQQTDDSNYSAITPIHLAFAYHLPHIASLMTNGTFGITKTPSIRRFYRQMTRQSSRRSTIRKISILDRHTWVLALNISSALELHCIHGIASQTNLSQTIQVLPFDSLSNASDTGQTAFSHAILVGNIPVVSALLERCPSLVFKAIPDPTSPNNTMFPIHLAAHTATKHTINQDPLTVLQTLQKFDAEALDRTDSRGRRALDIAVMACSESATEWLLKSGARVNAINEIDHTSAVFWVTNPAVLETLLRYGADLRVCDNQGYSAARRLLLSNNVNIFSRYLNTIHDLDEDSIGTLQLAIKGDRANVVEKLFLRTLSEVDTPDITGSTALMSSISCVSLSTVSFLLSAGADWSIRNHDGRCALDYLLQPTKDDRALIVEIFTNYLAKDAPIEQGWDFICRMASNRTDLALLAIEQLLTRTKLKHSHWLADGREIKETEVQVMSLRIEAGETPLHVAARYLNCKAVRALLHSEIDMNVARSDGETPLMVGFNVRILLGASGTAPEYFEVCWRLLQAEQAAQINTTWKVALEREDIDLLAFLLVYANATYCQPPPPVSTLQNILHNIINMFTVNSSYRERHYSAAITACDVFWKSWERYDDTEHTNPYTRWIHLHRLKLERILIQEVYESVGLAYLQEAFEFPFWQDHGFKSSSTYFSRRYQIALFKKSANNCVKTILNSPTDSEQVNSEINSSSVEEELSLPRLNLTDEQWRTCDRVRSTILAKVETKTIPNEGKDMFKLPPNSLPSRRFVDALLTSLEDLIPLCLDDDEGVLEETILPWTTFKEEMTEIRDLAANRFSQFFEEVVAVEKE